MIASTPEESDDFVIEHGDVAIGKLGMWRLPEIGYIIAPAYWGRGPGSEALRAILPHVFARPDVERMTADVDPPKLRSLAMLEHQGFVRTGYASATWHTHTGIADSVYLALQRANQL